MRHVVVCGLGRFGLRVVERLRQAQVPVTVVSGAGTRRDRIDRAKAAGAVYIEGDFRFDEVRVRADVSGAEAVILATADDAANLEAALEVRGEAPEVRVLMRLSEPKLSARLTADFGLTAALSLPTLAAPDFVAAALEPPAPAPPEVAPVRRPARVRRPWRPEILVLPSLLVVLFATGVLLFHHVLDMTWIDAAYFTSTTVTTVGYGDYSLREAPAIVKLFGVALMFGGVVLIAMLSSLLTNFVVSGAAVQVRQEALARRQRDHVILCGLGTVGSAIAADLHARRVPVVVVNDISVDAHTELPHGVPLIVGDATHAGVLLQAGLDRARAVIAATSSDALNLEIGLMAQGLVEERRPDRPLRLVLRCFDPDLARRVHAVSSNYTLLSAAKIAAPLFAARALGKESLL